MKNTLWISLVVVGLLVAFFFVGKRQKWFGGIDPELEGTDAVDPEPETNNDDLPTMPTGTTTTNPPTSKPGRKEVPLDPTKPKPPATFNAKDQAVKVARLLASILDENGQDVQAFDILLKYTDNELRAVHNSWLQVYAKGGGGGIKSTLREMVKTEVVWSTRPDAIKKKQLVLQRFDTLKI